MTDDKVDRVLAGIGLRRDDVNPAALAVIEQHINGTASMPGTHDMNDLLRGRAPVPEQVEHEQSEKVDADPFAALRLEVARSRGLPEHLVPLLQGETITDLLVECDRFTAAAEPPTPIPAVPQGPQGTRPELTATEFMNSEFRRASGRPDTF